MLDYSDNDVNQGLSGKAPKIWSCHIYWYRRIYLNPFFWSNFISQKILRSSLKPESVVSKQSTLTVGYSASPSLAKERCNCTDNEICVTLLQRLLLKVTEVPSRIPSLIQVFCVHKWYHSQWDQINLFSHKLFHPSSLVCSPGHSGTWGKKEKKAPTFFPWMLVHDCHAEKPKLPPFTYASSLSSPLIS